MTQSTPATSDTPLLAYHVDLKRPMWTRAYLDETVTRLLDWGYNALVYELEDKLRFTRYPQIAHPDAWTAAETADFVAAARARGMDIIPLIQSLGHAEAIAGRPELAHLREHPDAFNQYDPVSPEVLTLLCELFDETLAAFAPARYFHIGGDETWRLGTSPRHQATVAEIGIGGLYLRHMLPILRHVWERGVRPMIWADMLLTYPETLLQIPDYVVLVDWEYNRTGQRTRTVRLWGEGQRTWPQIREYLRTGDARAQLVQRYAADAQTEQDGTLKTYYHVHALHDMGRDVVTASAARSGSDTQALARTLHAANVAESVRHGTTYGLGELVTSWTVRHVHPEVTMPAVYAAPYALRHPGPLDEAALYRDFTQHVFGVSAPELLDVHRAGAVEFPFSQTTTIRHAAHRLLQGQDVAAQLRQAVQESRRAPELYTAGSAPWDLLPPLPASCAPADRLAHAIHGTQASHAAIQDARPILDSIRARAHHGHVMLDFWREGLDLAAFYGAFALAALQDHLALERETLLSTIATLRPRTRSLWERTFAPNSIDLELDTRYGFHEAYLGATASTASDVLHRIADPVQPPYHLADPTERLFGTFGSPEAPGPLRPSAATPPAA